MVFDGAIYMYGIIIAMDITRLWTCYSTTNTQKSIIILDHMRSHDTIMYLYHSVHSKMNHFHKLERSNYSNRTHYSGNYKY